MKIKCMVLSWTFRIPQFPKNEDNGWICFIKSVMFILKLKIDVVVCRRHGAALGTLVGRQDYFNVPAQI